MRELPFLVAHTLESNDLDDLARTILILKLERAVVIRRGGGARTLAMNKKSVAAAIVAAFFATGVPAFAATAPTQGSAIRLDSVQIEQSYGVFNNFEAGVVQIAFTNTSAVPVTAVVFDLLGYQGRIIAQYNDVGSFAQGATMRHRFPNTHEDYDQKIQVGRVTYADGTTWEAPVRGTTPAIIFPSS
jgi:hypothetical protein